MTTKYILQVATGYGEGWYLAFKDDSAETCIACDERKAIRFDNMYAVGVFLTNYYRANGKLSSLLVPWERTF